MFEMARLNDHEGMDISINIDWQSAIAGLKSITTAAFPWAYIAVGFVATDLLYCRRKGRRQ